MAIESAYPPQAWELEQLTKLCQQRPDWVTMLLRRLLAQDGDLRWALVVGAYLDRQLNLGKAAELLDMAELQLRDRFMELGVPLRLGPGDLAEAKAEVEAVRSWLSRPSEA